MESLIRFKRNFVRRQSYIISTTTVLRDYRLPSRFCFDLRDDARFANVYTRGENGRLGCISVRFTTLRGKRCYHNDCNIMTPRYGKIVFISDLRLYTGKRARAISPTIVCVVHGRSRLNRAQCKPFRSLFPSPD